MTKEEALEKIRKHFEENTEEFERVAGKMTGKKPDGWNELIYPLYHDMDEMDDYLKDHSPREILSMAYTIFENEQFDTDQKYFMTDGNSFLRSSDVKDYSEYIEDDCYVYKNYLGGGYNNFYKNLLEYESELDLSREVQKIIDELKENDKKTVREFLEENDVDEWRVAFAETKTNTINIDDLEEPDRQKILSSTLDKYINYEIDFAPDYNGHPAEYLFLYPRKAHEVL